MFTTKLRLLALLLALVTCVSVFVGCGSEKDDEEDTKQTDKENKEEEDEEIDVEDALKDAYKKTCKAKFLTLSLMIQRDIPDVYRVDTVTGEFKKSNDGKITAFLEEHSETEDSYTEWFYEDDVLYGYDGQDKWSSEYDSLTMESACMEHWVLSAFPIDDFNAFAKRLSKEKKVKVSTSGKTTIISLKGDSEDIMKLLAGEEVPLSQFFDDTAKLKVTINSKGYLSEISLESIRNEEIGIRIIASLDNFNKSIGLKYPAWMNEPNDGSYLEPDDGSYPVDDYSEPYLELYNDTIYLEKGDTVWIDDCIADGNYDYISLSTSDSQVVRIDGNEEIYAYDCGQAVVYILVENEYGTREYTMDVIVETDEPMPFIDAYNGTITMEEGDVFDILDYISIENAESYSFRSSRSSVVKINNFGDMEAIQEGNAYITITAKNSVCTIEETIDVCVVAPEIPEVAIFDESARIVIGKTYNLDDMCFSMADELKYASSNTRVATVDPYTGVITGVGEGECFITIYVIVNGKEYKRAEFPVTVELPWIPTDPTSMEVVNAKNLLTRYETFDWYPVNVSYMPEYNVRGDESTIAGPAEIWQNTLHILFRFWQSEVNATIGCEDMSTYNFYFDFYYRPYDEYNDRGNYKKAVLQPWSIYTAENAIYRCKFYDEFFVKNDGLIEDQLYEVVIVVREGENRLGYAEAELTWTDSCAIFVEAAEQDKSIIK